MSSLRMLTPDEGRLAVGGTAPATSCDDSFALKLNWRRFGSGSEAVFCRSLNFSDPPRTAITAEWRTGVVSRGEEAIEWDFEWWNRADDKRVHLPTPVVLS